jgi:hypothetical protein
MKPHQLLFFLFIIFLGTASSLGNSISSRYPSDRSTVTTSSVFPGRSVDDGESKKEDETIVRRCRAQELSPGAALGIMVVLATGSVVHMPGCFLASPSNLYRLAPELALLELIPLLLLIGDAIFLRRKSLKIAVSAVLLMRHESRDTETYNSQQRDDDTATVATDQRESSSFLEHNQAFGLKRVLGDALMVIAFIKSAAVKGSIRTSLLAASYALPFFIIEILSFAALNTSPVAKTRVQSRAELAEIDNLIQTLNMNRESVWDLDPNGPSSRPYRAFAWINYVVFGLPAVLHLFWPFSVVVFLLFDFQERHVGKWIFTYLAWVEWIFWLAVVACVLLLLASIPMLIFLKFPEKQKKYTRALERFQDVLSNIDVLSLYALLKFGLVVRFYSSQYTGKGTIKPAWLDWLG